MRLRCPEGCPSADTVSAVALAWADAIWLRAGLWTPEQDAPRLRRAFRALAAHATRWPAPADLWQYLPSRPEPPRLEPPAPTPEERARIREIKNLYHDKDLRDACTVRVARKPLSGGHLTRCGRSALEVRHGKYSRCAARALAALAAGAGAAL